MKRAVVTEAVRHQKQGRGAKPKPLPTQQSVRVPSGLKITASGRKGFDRATFLAALDEARSKIVAELGDDQAAA